MAKSKYFQMLEEGKTDNEASSSLHDSTHYKSRFFQQTGGDVTKETTGIDPIPASYEEPKRMADWAQSMVDRYNPEKNKDIPLSPVAQMEAEKKSDVDLGTLGLGTLLKGADQFAGSATSTASWLEGALLKPLGAVLGDDELYTRGPLYMLNQEIQRQTQANKEYFAEDFEKAGKLGKFLDTYGVATVAAIPQAALAFMTAGASLGAQAGTSGLQAASTAANASGLAHTIYSGVSSMAKNPQFWYSFMQQAGPGYDQAKADGADDLRATAYGLLTGLVNSAVEIGGGIDTLPKNLQNAARGGTGALKQWVFSSLDEGREEVVQGAISQLAQSLYGKNNPFFSVTDENAVLSPVRAAQEFAGGAFVGGVLGGGQILANSALNSAINNSGTGGETGTPPPVVPQESVQEAAPTADTAFTPAAVQSVTEAPVQADAPQIDAAQAAEAPVIDAEILRLFGNPDSVSSPDAEAPAVNQTDTVNQDAPFYDNLGSAKEGFTGQGMEGVERTSRLLESMPYTKLQEYATSMTKEDYNNLFRYQSQTEQRSMNLAEELVYYLQDGKKTFIRDISEPQYQELIKSLDEAPAWNAPMADAAHLIQIELQGRAAEMEIESEEYVDFIKMMKEHSTSTSQGVQSYAKWSRPDNLSGSASELDAWENLQNSTLSDEQKMETFHRIVQWDSQIEAVEAGDTQALKDIVLQIGQERGVLSGITGKQSNLLYNIASKSLDGLTFDQLKQFAYASTEAMSLDSAPVNWGQRIKTIQVLNMLSSPITPARNLTGNTTFYGVDAVSMDVASIIDMALSKITGTRSVAFENFPLSRKARQAAAQAARLSAAEVTLDVDMGSGTNRYGTGGKRTFKANGTFLGSNFLSRVMSSLERNQGYLLQTSDEFFKGLARSNQGNIQSLIDQGKIKNADTEYAKSMADQLAKYRTFQDSTYLSDEISNIHDLLNAIPIFHIGDSGKRRASGRVVGAFGLGDIVAPFTRVAGNLVSRAIEYSPYNLVKGTLETAKLVANAANGNVISPSDQAKAVSNFGRGAVGTAIAYGFMLLAQSGFLRQADDENDENVKALNQSEGIQGTQLNISAVERALRGEDASWQSGDTLVDLSSIEPLNFLMNLGTEMAKSDQNPIVSSFLAGAGSIMDASSELPVMGFIGDTATDVVRYNQPVLESLANAFVNTATSSVIPNFARAIAKGSDDRPRNTYAGDTFLDDVIANIKNSIPGLRQTLPGSVNSFGEEKTYSSAPGWQFFNSVFNPVGVNTYTQSEVSQELERLRELTGETDFYPTKSIPTELSYTDDNGKTNSVALSYEQRQSFQEDRGTIAYSTMEAMMNTNGYRYASASEQSALLNRCEEYAYEVAKQNILGSGTAPGWVNNAKNAERDIGISTEEYLSLYEKYGSALSGNSYENVKEAVRNGLSVEEYMTYKENVSGITADKDPNGNTISGSKKEKVISAINSMDLSPSEKDWLYYLNGYAESTINDVPWRN